MAEEQMGITGRLKDLSNLGAMTILAGLLVYQSVYQHPEELRDIRSVYLAEMQAERQAHKENVSILAKSIEDLADALRSKELVRKQ